MLVWPTTPVRSTSSLSPASVHIVIGPSSGRAWPTTSISVLQDNTELLVFDSSRFSLACITPSSHPSDKLECKQHGWMDGWCVCVCVCVCVCCVCVCVCVCVCMCMCVNKVCFVGVLYYVIPAEENRNNLNKQNMLLFVLIWNWKEEEVEMEGFLFGNRISQSICWKQQSHNIASVYLPTHTPNKHVLCTLQVPIELDRLTGSL